jgi:uncharacterized protein YcbK (DUF882 family)
MIQRPYTTRRGLLHRATQLTAAVALPLVAPTLHASNSDPGANNERRLSFFHTHTRERLSLAFAVGERYVNESLALLDRFLRDHYSGEIGHIDPRLYDLLHRLQADLGVGAAGTSFEIISAYRCPATNARLQQQRGGGVASRSLHMEGRALDVRLQGVSLADLRDAACASRAGGVGYYAREQFVHIDTGRVRVW